jgi:Tol biopolymer transport system component
MTDLQHDLRAMFQRLEGNVPAQPQAPPRLLHRARWRQIGVVSITIATVLFLVIGSLVGLHLILPAESDGAAVPADQPSMGSLPYSSTPTALTSSRLAVVLGNPNPGIYSIEADGTGAKQLLAGSYEDVASSPDGGKIAFVKNGGIFVMNADGTSVTQLTSDGSDTSPTWSPDRTLIAFSRETPSNAGSAEIFQVPASGGETKQLTNDSLLKYNPAWSPDGNQITFAGYHMTPQGPSSVRLYVMRSDGSGMRLLGGDNISQPAWSPDGTQIAFAQQNGSLWVIDSDGTGSREIYQASGPHAELFSPSWSPDGTRIAFVAGSTATELQVYVSDSSGASPAQVTGKPSEALSVAWIK